MCQKLIRLLCCRIKGNRVINHIIRIERDLLVSAVDGGGRSIDQVLHRMIAASFKNIEEPDHIRFDIGLRVIDGIPHPRLSCQIHNNIKMIGIEKGINQFFIRQIAFDEHMPDSTLHCQFLNEVQSILFQANLILVVHAVEGYNCAG